MSYNRTIPRDLFNEAKLLKCLGQLSLLIHDEMARPLSIDHDETEFPGFLIEQRDSDGALYCSNLQVFCKGRLIGLWSPYNRKDAYPLTFSLDDEEGDVFTDEGELSEEFRGLISTLTANH